MKIYITGIAGFLGSHLAKKIKNQGHKVGGNDNMIQGDAENLPKDINFHKTDCCNYSEMVKNLKGYDIVYHCAATAHEGLSVFSPNFITKNIYQASISVITASIVNKVKKFVLCSSMARYGTQKNPFTEDMSPSPQDPYGIAKVAAEQTLQLLSEVHGMNYNIAVPHNIVGPNQKYDDPFRNVMSIFINRNLQMKPSIIYGDGSQIRDFVYVEDVAKANFAAMMNKTEFGLKVTKQKMKDNLSGTPLMRQYGEVKSKYPDCIILFRIIFFQKRKNFHMI